MHRNLPASLNIHIFSFLNQLELRQRKVINKACKKSIEHSLTWENLLKRDFFAHKNKHSDYTEGLYDEYMTKVKNESALFIEYAVPYLYSFQIKVNDFASASTNIAFHEQNYLIRTKKLDNVLLQGIEKFRIMYEFLSSKKRSFNETTIRNEARNFIEKLTNLGTHTSKPVSYDKEMTNIMLLVLTKINAYTILHIFLKSSSISQACLDEMLTTACRFSNMEVIQLLKEFDNTANKRHDFTRKM